MKLRNPFKRVPEPQKRSRKKTNQWLNRVAREPSSRALVESMLRNNPVLQAAVVSHITGVELDPAAIKIETPQEAFRQHVINEAIRELSRDQEFMRMAKDMVMDMIYENAPDLLGLAKGHPDARAGMSQMQGSRQPDIFEMADTVDRVRAKFGGGGGTLATLLNSPLALELVKTLVPLFFGNRNGQSNDASATYSVGQADGTVIEMTKEAYEQYLKQAAQLASQGAAPNAEIGPNANPAAQSQKPTVPPTVPGPEAPQAASVQNDDDPPAASTAVPVQPVEPSGSGTAGTITAEEETKTDRSGTTNPSERAVQVQPALMRP
jgi:hypothetical protein